MLRTLALSFTSIFVAMDIIGVLPLYLSITRHLHQTPSKREELRQIINNSMLVAFLVALVFVFIGQHIFTYLGITLFDFKIAGGIVLLLVSLADLVGGPEVSKQASGSTGIVPLAVPLITGPGVLTAILWQIGTFGYAITLTALVLNYALAWAILRNSNRITKVIGNDGTVVFSKIAALLLAALSVAMIRSGLFEAIRAFTQSQSSL